MDFYNIDQCSQIIIEDIQNFKERSQFLQTKRRPFNRKRLLPDSFEGSKQRHVIANILNKLIEVFFTIKEK